MKLEFKKFDYIIMAAVAVIAVLTLIIFFFNGRIAKTPVVSENTVVFQVFFRGITLSENENPFKVLDESFITIRNVPHKKVTIIGAQKAPRMTIIPDAKGGNTLVQDVSNPFMYDILVTLYDEAKITDDGAVLGGNKLKMGLPIVLEGQNYRFSGTLSNIKVLSEDEAKELKESIDFQREQLANPKPIMPIQPVPYAVPENKAN